jgi:hypothetical protein
VVKYQSERNNNSARKNMAEMRIERGELPGSLCVVAVDDERYQRDIIFDTLTSFNPNYAVHRPTDLNDLVQTVAQVQPHVITLDDNYDHHEPDTRPWQITNTEYEQMIRVYLTQGRGLEEDLANYLNPNALNFATLLKITGYAGRIIVVSSAPPLEKPIAVREDVVGVRPLVDATMLKKRSLFRESTYRQLIGNRIISETNDDDMSFEDSMKWILSRVFPAGSL